MVQDWLVGILGFVLVVGSMVIAIEAVEAPASGDDAGATGQIGGPPPLLGQDSWTTESCLTARLTWEIPGESASEHTAPWVPKNTTRATLWAYECEASVVSGLTQQGPISGGAVWIEVQPPAGNLTGDQTAETYLAQPEVFVGRESDLSEATAEHGFEVTTADVSIAETDLLVGRQVTISWNTDDGQIEARTVLSSSGQGATLDVGLLAPIEKTFGYQVGQLSATEVSAGTVTVTNQGDTWYSKLGLSPSPDEAVIGQQGSWGFTLLSRDLGGTSAGNATSLAQTT